MDKQRQVLTWASGAAVVGALGWAGWKILHKESEPGYRILGAKGDLEVRQYAPMLVAVTELEGDFEASLNEGFHRLAGYIFGKNQRRTPPAINIGAPPATAPEQTEKIPMTAPVGFQRLGNQWRMTFVLPPEYTLDSAPKPADSRVHLEAVPPRRVAALRFSGAVPEAVMKSEQERLLTLLREQGLQPTGEPVLAQYNSPFMLPFLRRNETLVEVRTLDSVH